MDKDLDELMDGNFTWDELAKAIVDKFKGEAKELVKFINYELEALE